MVRQTQGKFNLHNEEPTVEEKLRSVASPSRGRRQNNSESQQGVESPFRSQRQQDFESLRKEVRMMVGDSESIDHLTRAVRAEARAEKAELDLLRVQASLVEKEQRYLDTIKLLDKLRTQNEDLRRDLEFSRQRVAESTSRLKEPTVNASSKLEKQFSDGEARAELWKRCCEEFEKQLAQTSHGGVMQESFLDSEKKLSHLEGQAADWNQHCQDMKQFVIPVHEQTSETRDLHKHLFKAESQAELWRKCCQELEQKQGTQGSTQELQNNSLKFKEMINTLQKESQSAQSESQIARCKLPCSEVEKKPARSGCSSARSSAMSQPKSELTSCLEAELSLARAEVETLRNRLWQVERELTQGKRQSSNGLAELQRLRSQCSELEQNVHVEHEKLLSCKADLHGAESNLSRKSEQLHRCQALLVEKQSIISTDRQELQRALLQSAQSTEAAEAAQAAQATQVARTQAHLEEVRVESIAQLSEVKLREARQVKKMKVLMEELLQEVDVAVMLRERSGTFEEQLEKERHLQRSNFDRGTDCARSFQREIVVLKEQAHSLACAQRDSETLECMQVDLECLQSECQEQARLASECSSKLQEVERAEAHKEALLKAELQQMQDQHFDEREEIRLEQHERDQSYKQQRRELLVQVERQQGKCLILSSKLEEAEAECLYRPQDAEHCEECIVLSSRVERPQVKWSEGKEDCQEHAWLNAQVQALRAKTEQADEAEQTRTADFASELAQVRCENREHCSHALALRAELCVLKQEQSTQLQGAGNEEGKVPLVEYADEVKNARNDREDAWCEAAQQKQEVAALQAEVLVLEHQRASETEKHKRELAVMCRELQTLHQERHACVTSTTERRRDTVPLLFCRRAEIAEEQASEAAVQCVAGKLEALQQKASEAQARRAQGQVMLAGARQQIKGLHSALRNEESIVTHQNHELMQASAESRYWYEHSEHFRMLADSRHVMVLTPQDPSAPFPNQCKSHSAPSSPLHPIPSRRQTQLIVHPNQCVASAIQSCTAPVSTISSCSRGDTNTPRRELQASKLEVAGIPKSPAGDRRDRACGSSSIGWNSSRVNDRVEQEAQMSDEPAALQLLTPEVACGKREHCSPYFGGKGGQDSVTAFESSSGQEDVTKVEMRAERWKSLCAEHESAALKMSMEHMQAQVECSQIRIELHEAFELQRSSSEAVEVLKAEVDASATRFCQVESEFQNMMEATSALKKCSCSSAKQKASTCPLEMARVQIQQTEKQFSEARTLLEARITNLLSKLRAAEEESLENSTEFRAEGARRACLQAQKSNLLEALRESEAACVSWRSESKQEKMQFSKATVELVDCEAALVDAVQRENREAARFCTEIAQLTLEEERAREGFDQEAARLTEDLACSQDNLAFSFKRNDKWMHDVESRLKDAEASADRWYKRCECGDRHLRAEMQKLSESMQAEANLQCQLTDAQRQLVDLQGWGQDEKRCAEQDRHAAFNEAMAFSTLKTEEVLARQSILAQRSELAYAQGEAEDLSRECKGWRARLETATEEAKTEHHKSHIEFRMASKDCLRWQDKVSVLQRVLEEQKTNLNRQLGEQRSEMQQARDRTAQMQQRCDEWQARAEDYQDEFCRVEAEAERQRGLALCATREHHQSEERLNHLTSLHKHAEETAAKWQCACEDRSIDVAQLQAQVTLSGEEIMRLRTQAESLHSQLSVAELSAAANLSSAGSETQPEVLQRLGDVQRSPDTYQKEMSWLQKSEAEIQAEASSWEHAALRTSEQLGEQTEELEKLRASLSNRTTSNRERSASSFASSAVAVMRSLESTPSKRSDAGAAGDVGMKINIAHAEAAAKAAEIEILRTELRECQGREEELTRALQMEQSEASVLRCHLKDISSQNSQSDAAAVALGDVTDGSLPCISPRGGSSRRRSTSQAKGEVALAERLAEFHSCMGQSPNRSRTVNSQSPTGEALLNSSGTSPFASRSRISLGSIKRGAQQTSATSGSPPRRHRGVCCPQMFGNASCGEGQSSSLSLSPTPGSRRRFNRSGLLEKGSALVGLEALTAKAAAALEACRTSSMRSPAKQ